MKITVYRTPYGDKEREVPIKDLMSALDGSDFCPLEDLTHHESGQFQKVIDAITKMELEGSLTTLILHDDWRVTFELEPLNPPTIAMGAAVSFSDVLDEDYSLEELAEHSANDELVIPAGYVVASKNRVIAFLTQNSCAIGLLEAVLPVVKSIFGEDTSVALQAVSDHDSAEGTTLLAMIMTADSIASARTKRDNFYKNWWNKSAPNLELNLYFDLEFV